MNRMHSWNCQALLWDSLNWSKQYTGIIYQTTFAMSLFVKCETMPLIGGEYFWNINHKAYEHNNHQYFLEKDQAGCWFISNAKSILARTENPTTSPTDRTKWLMCQNDVPSYEVDVWIENSAQVDFDVSAVSSTINSKSSQIEITPYVELPQDWERKEINGTVTYYNKMTKKLLGRAPEILCNVSGHQFNCKRMTTLVYAPLMQDDMGKEGIALLHAATWDHSLDFWSQSFKLSNILTERQSRLESVGKKTQELNAEMMTSEKTLGNIRDQLDLIDEKRNYANQRSETMTERLGKVHVQRDAAAAEGAAFPSGEEIKIKYLSVFGDSFEPAGGDVMAFIEDALGVKGEAKIFLIFVRDIVTPLFDATRAYALRMIQEKYSKLAEVFGLPKEGEEQDSDDDIARHFFLASQQVPLLAAAKNIDEPTVLRICGAMGETVEKVLTQMPAWAEEHNANGNFDLFEMVRVLVWLNTAIELSDPKCYLYPRIRFAHRHVANKDIYKEVFSPGTKKFGLLASGDEVEVVLPGLYFEVPIEIAPPGAQGEAAPVERAVAVPVVPVRVRRLPKENFVEITEQASAEAQEAQISHMSSKIENALLALRAGKGKMGVSAHN